MPGTGVSIRSLSDMAAADRLALTYWLALGGRASGPSLVVALIMRSRLGLALRAIRDSEVGAASLGVNVQRTKRIVFLVAAIGCAVAGAVVLPATPADPAERGLRRRVDRPDDLHRHHRRPGPDRGADRRDDRVLRLAARCLADYGAAYLVALGLVAIAVVVVAPRGLWGLVESRVPALFAVQRRLIVSPVAATDRAEEPDRT